MATTPELVHVARRFPVGVELAGSAGAHFRVWAPLHHKVGVVLEDRSGQILREHPLTSEDGGYFSGFVADVVAGDLYRYRLGDIVTLFPDPASRFQPRGPHGPSQVIDPRFAWSDQQWSGLTLKEQVLYELHIGTFTKEGTWRAAIEHLQALAEIGITAVEMMPIAEFAGDFGWGYDGVDPYAPTRLYGEPDDLRSFIDRAHQLGLGVILDVVYNHFGPDGNYLGQFSRNYFSTRYKNEWGDPINFDDQHAAPVREFMTANAAYWIDEFHFDGLRLDATQQIFDASRQHVLAELTERARAAAPNRTVILVAENERQDVRGVRPIGEGGFNLDAQWNDDFHHTALVALTGRREAYYLDYLGTPQEFISCAKRGYLYQGQLYSWQRARRGTPTVGLSPERFITFLENHDQVANAPSGRGDRLPQITSPGLYRAMTAVWLLSPGIPMFFQGQEFGSTSPFMYFADHAGDLGKAVRSGRADFMSQFRTAATRPLVDTLPDPAAADTFERCKLDHAGRNRNPQILAMHRDLIAVRREQLYSSKRPLSFDGAVIGDHSFVFRWFANDRPSEDRLLVANFGTELCLTTLPEPLLAAPSETAWSTAWSSEDVRYGGDGTAAVEGEKEWRIPGLAAVLLAPRAL